MPILESLHVIGAAFLVLAAIATAIVLTFVVAPYGRHDRQGWGPTIPAKLAWIVMEGPTVLLFGWWYATGDHPLDHMSLYFLTMWMLHYVHRTFIFPFRMRSKGRRMPVLVAMLGCTFNTLNAWLNATWIATLGSYTLDWLTDPRLILGTSLFFLGMWTNVWADTKLIRLRRDGGSGYKIPHGGLYQYISCPNYAGEILEWTGWAIATWSYAGGVFAIYTMANLAPRAFANHRWYKETFPDYPRERTALIPFVV